MVAFFQKETKINYLFRPNIASQSNLSPQDAADIWMQFGAPLSQQGYTTMITPAVTSADSGTPWMQEFLKACKTCSVRIVSYHSPSAWFQQFWLVSIHGRALLRP